MNHLFFVLDLWQKYFEEVTDTGGVAAFDAVVGGPNQTHSDLADLIADAGLGTNVRVLVTASEALASTAQFTKNDWELVIKPGVTISKGAATTGIQISASGFRINGGRFAGFGGGGDIAILIDAAKDFGMIHNVRFAGNDTDVSDLSGTASQVGNINE